MTVAASLTHSPSVILAQLASARGRTDLFPNLEIVRGWLDVRTQTPPLVNKHTGGQFNRIIENLFEILVLENLIEKYFLVLKSQSIFQKDFQ